MIAALACTAVLVVLVGTSAVVERRRYWRERLDAALDAMAAGFRETARLIGEELLPAVERMAESVRAFGESLRRALVEVERQRREREES